MQLALNSSPNYINLDKIVVLHLLFYSLMHTLKLSISQAQK